jgi:arylsulfatase A-like enzyme
MRITSQPGTSGGTLLRGLGIVVLAVGFAAGALAATPDEGARTPNILFFIMDDVGIDQMKTFGYGGATPPATPNIDAIAQAGVKFRNTWATPECSPSRSSIFTGRHPHRTNIQAIITDSVLANSQVSPFEVTVPKLLRSNGARYRSGMFGKFHMAGPQNNPFGNGGPHSIGWDYFQGFIEGEPYPIDSWAGAETAPDAGTGPHSCGYVSGTAAGARRVAEGASAPIAGRPARPSSEAERGHVE